MRTPRYLGPLVLALALTSSLALAACGDDDAKTPADAAVADAPPVVVDGAVADAPPAIPDATPAPDAHPANLDCPAADAGVADIADPINISGLAKSRGISASTPVAGATVQVRKLSDDSVIATAETDANGAYHLSVPTGGVASAAYLHASGAGLASTDVFTPRPVDSDITGLTITMFDSNLIPLLGQFAGTQIVAGDGVVILQLEDCDGESIEGATVTVSGGNADTKVVYTAAGSPLPDSSQTHTSNTGTVWIVNLPPGDHLVQGHYGAFPPAMLQQTIRVLADDVALALIVP
jgi:hypothetical protein